MEHETARNGNRNERQLRTQRKIKVNVQITFVLWLMESMANIVNIVATFAGGIGQTTFTLNMILYLIILPYIYLQNTSYNKYRIAEEGWQNILRNILPCTANKGRNNLTRVYVISNDPLVCSRDKDNDVVIHRIIHNESHLQTTNKSELHLPAQEEHNNAVGTTEQDKSQSEQFALRGMKHSRPFYPF